MMFQLGQTIEVGNINWYAKGKIIKIVEPNQLLTTSEMEVYGGFANHKRTPEYKSVEGSNCSRQRLIIEKANGNYVIVPVNFERLGFREVE